MRGWMAGALAAASMIAVSTPQTGDAYPYHHYAGCRTWQHNHAVAGTVIGGVTGGIIGNAIGHGRLGGTLIGAGVGAVAGHQIGKSTHRC
jgi:Glycine zipper 2TM domain